MKKHSKIYLGIFLILGVCAIVFYYQNKKMNDSSYVTMTYTASNNTYTVFYMARANHPVLNNFKEYEIVTKKNKLNRILKKINFSDVSEFNDDFFKSQNLLVIQAGIDPIIHELNIKDTEVDISISNGSPLTSKDQMLTYSLYLIPINKDVKKCNIESVPDLRIY